MQLHFKHEDTQLLITAAALLVVLSAVAWLWVGEAALLLALALILVMLGGLQLNIHRLRQVADEKQLRHVQALAWVFSTFSFRAPLPYLTGWAGSPEFISTLVATIREHEPRTVVELGSGASTVVMAYALEEGRHGHLIALDHKEEYAADTRRQLARHALQRQADVRHAPLESMQVEEQTWTWYDVHALDDCPAIDMLVVDGPPYETQPMARYPALPMLFDKLSDEALVVVDDAYRDDEEEMLKRWLHQFKDLELKLKESPKGTAILYRKKEKCSVKESV